MIEKTYVAVLYDAEGRYAGSQEARCPEQAWNTIELHAEATGGDGDMVVSGKCHCGESVMLISLTNECEGCGAQYNPFGQELRRSEWSDYEIEMGLDG